MQKLPYLRLCRFGVRDILQPHAVGVTLRDFGPRWHSRVDVSLPQTDARRRKGFRFFSAAGLTAHIIASWRIYKELRIQLGRDLLVSVYQISSRIIASCSTLYLSVYSRRCPSCQLWSTSVYAELLHSPYLESRNLLPLIAKVDADRIQQLVLQVSV